MTTLAQTDPRRRFVRAARIGGALARQVRVVAADVLAVLPEQPAPHDAVPLCRRVDGKVRRLQEALAERLRLLLTKAAVAEHRDTITALKRSAAIVREDATTDYLRLIIPAPALHWLRALVGLAHERLTRLIDPQKASAAVLRGVSAGHDRRRIAADLAGVFGGYETAARRVARTEGARVATAAQLAASESIPDLIVGYQIDCVLDTRVRPAHRERHGTRYWRHPERGQLGLAAMPHPPIEADGSLAWNCRCTLFPLFADDLPDTSAVARS